MVTKSPILPTSVVGSYATPSWLITAIQEMDKGNYGQTDIDETFNDAVKVAISDQEQAGIDIISDGEMRRWHFVQSFYKKMTGIQREPDLRKIGVYGYDSPARYKAVSKIEVPEGLGIIEEFDYLKTQTNLPVKMTCPGPLTLTIHVRPGEIYKNRIDMAWELADVINRELKSLVAKGANFIQIDEPSFAIIPGEMDDWIDLYNATVKDVNAKLALHVCFGNLGSRPRGKRQYEWMFPKLLDANAEQLVLEYANREMIEADLWSKYDIPNELGAGVVDIKSFHVETPEDVAERIRILLKHTNPEKMSINPDCGFFQLPRWLAYKKLQALVAGTQLVRSEL
ncbi:MAG: methionine synthase [SAR202 cluster bacterium]|nr:methionine synthase [SAR202 cluster bacterium]|tara:strand:- start:1310 stop:2329 length:1020 start_codon:yes stop_codon:yes gene_type:complete